MSEKIEDVGKDERGRQKEAKLLKLVHTTRKLSERARALEEEAHVDSLTGLLNRRGFDTRMSGLAAPLEQERRAGEKSERVALIACDIDNFKEINDKYGHAAGDAVLRAIASILRSEVRDTDYVARVGGEEFILVLPGATEKKATEIASRLRSKVEGSPATYGNIDRLQVSIPFTASFGVAYADTREELSATVEHADTALYRAKANGKNTVSRYAEFTAREQDS